MARVASYTRSDIRQALDVLDLPPGCTVFLTAGFGFLGTYESGEAFADLIAELQSCIGVNGTIVVPTYSYTFGDADEVSGQLPRFSVAQTPSQLGQFSEWFRAEVATVRSRDPMVSVAIAGAEAQKLVSDLPATSYGYGCLFERLLTEDSYVLNVGLGTKWTPFIHYVDFLCNVPHRYEKSFSGIIDYGSTQETVSWTYHVPIRVPNARGLGEKNGLAALEAGLWRYSRLGRARVFVTSYKDYFQFSLERTMKDKWNLAVGPPIDFPESRLGD